MHVIVGMYENSRALKKGLDATYIHMVPSHPNLNQLDLTFQVENRRRFVVG